MDKERLTRINRLFANRVEADMERQRRRNRQFAGLPVPRLELVKPQETFWDSWGNDVRHNPTGKLDPEPFDGRTSPPYKQLLQ